MRAVKPKVGKLVDQTYKVVAIGSLLEHPENPRIGEISKIEESIMNNDFYGAVYVQKSTNRIIAGNHRWKAAKHVGISKMPAIFLNVNDEQALKILLVDNRTSDQAKNNNALLLKALEQLHYTNGLLGSGYTNQDMGKLIAMSNPLDTKPEKPKHTKQSKIVHKCPKCAYEWSA